MRIKYAHHRERVSNRTPRFLFLISPISRGMTLIETIIGVAIMLAVFLSLFGGFRLAIELVYNTKAKTGAVALITEQMEYVRGRSYDAVGTVGGIPSGAIAQVQEKSLNNILYTIRTLIQYVDAPEDGLGAADTNGVSADYKSVKIEVGWTVRGSPRSTFAVTRISPHGVESLTSGGTLRVNVFDALAAPISGVTVRVENAASSPAIDVSASTDSTGAVLFPGAPPAAGYHITVTKPSYSSSTTYAQTTANPDPDPGNVAVANKQTTTASFGIDVLAALQVLSFSPPGPGSFDDTFVDGSNLSASSSVSISAGALHLASDGSTYAAQGSATSNVVSPSNLVAWGTLILDTSAPAGTNVGVSVYYLNGSEYVLVPDSVLPGNSLGFSGGIIDLSTLQINTYGALQAKAVVTTADSSVTPLLSEWKFTYTAGPTPLPNVTFDIHGAKTIGTSGSGLPIYKYAGRYTTSQYGEKIFDPIEWDVYSVSLPSGSPYAVIERCPFSVSLLPNEHKIVSIAFGSSTTGSLLVYVSGSGVPITNADVTISGGAVNSTQTTSSCGQVFLGGLSAATYTVTVSAPGYQSYSDSISVSDATELSVSLNP